MLQTGAAKPSAYVQYAAIGGHGRSRRRENWMPFAVRLPFLVFFISLLLLCVGSLEYLVRQTKPLERGPIIEEVTKRQVQSQARPRALAVHAGLDYHRRAKRTTSVLITTTPAAVVPTTSKIQATTQVYNVVPNPGSYLTSTYTIPAVVPTTTPKANPPASSVQGVVPNPGSYLTSTYTTPAKVPTTTPVVVPTTTPVIVPTTTPKANPPASSVQGVVPNPGSYLTSTYTTPAAKVPPTTTPVVVPTTTPVIIPTTTPKENPPASSVQGVVPNPGSYLTSTYTTPAAKVPPTTTPVVIPTTTPVIVPTTTPKENPPASSVQGVVPNPGSYLTSTYTTPAAKAPPTTPVVDPTTTPKENAPTSAVNNVVPDTGSYLTSTYKTTATPPVGSSTYLDISRSAYLVPGSGSYLTRSTTTRPNDDKNPDTLHTTTESVADTVKGGYLSSSTSTESVADTVKGGYLSSSTTTLNGDKDLNATPTTQQTPYLTVSSGRYLDPSSRTLAKGLTTQGDSKYPDGTPTLKSFADTRTDKSAYLTVTSTMSGGVRVLITQTVTTTPRAGSLTGSSTMRTTRNTYSKTGTDTATEEIEPTVAVAQSSTTSATTTAVPTGAGLSQAISHLLEPNLEVEGGYTDFRYFLAMYLPSIIAVVLKEMWYAIASGLKMMEPFYQLNQPDGASARSSLLADYLASTISPYSIRRAFRGNASMMVILVGNAIMYLLAPLASESMTIYAMYRVRDKENTVHHSNPAWVLTLPLVRLLQAGILFVAIIVLLVIILRWKYRSGLSANPSKIATMAALLNHQNVVQRLNNIDSNASDKQIARSIAHDRYMVTNHVDLHGNSVCGLVKVGDIVPQGMHQLPQEDVASPESDTQLPYSSQQPRGIDEKKLAGRLLDSIFLIVIIGLLGTMIAYWVDHTYSSFNLFFISGKFGPRFVLSLGASVATALFQSYEREIRLLIPYRILAGRSAPAKDTVLRSVNGTAATALFQSARHGSWYHFLIAFLTIMGNVLIIAVTGVPFSESVMWISFNVCISLSVSISIFLLFASFSIFFWRRKNKTLKLPAEPNETMLRVWMSLSNQGNRLRNVLSDSEDIDSFKMRLNHGNALFWAGWIRDEHGRERWCVDMEPDGQRRHYSD